MFNIIADRLQAASPLFPPFLRFYNFEISTLASLFFFSFWFLSWSTSCDDCCAGFAAVYFF